MSFVDQTAIDDLLKEFQAAKPEDGASGRVPAGDFDPPPASTASADFNTADFAPEVRRLMAIEVPVIVLLGQRSMTVGEVMRLAVGAIIEFQKSAEEELELHINNKQVGKGQAVKVGENFGIRITNVAPVRETIKKLGGN